MPFDNSHHIGFKRFTVTGLLKQADEAFDAQDRAECISRIEEVYSVFDSVSAEHGIVADVVSPMLAAYCLAVSTRPRQ